VIYATASPGKWDHLKSLGVAAVLNSRTLDYADEIRSLTNGRGVDVVLNSLTGEYIPKNLEILAPGGRFVEIGKIGIWDDAQVKRVRPDVRYHAFDLGDVARQQPVLFRGLFLEVMAGFEKGEFQPLKRTEFGLTEGERAFRYMAQAKQIGKVVLTRRIRGVRVHSDGTYLITGGLGALGLETARWMALRGAKRIILCGRGVGGSGSAEGGVSASAKEKIDALERSGVGVGVFRADVAVREDVTRMIEALSGLPPLRGIVHAAGILDDGVIGEQTWERFVRVMSPKIDGAWNLYEATAGLSLDFFVCYSSAAAILGSPGQSSYAAANAFLDLLAHDLRRSGVRATTVNWGPWDGIGMAAAHPETLAASVRMGVKPIRLAEAPGLFEAVFAYDSAQMFVANIDWELYASRVPAQRDVGFLSRLLEKRTDDRRSPKPAIRAKILAAAAGDRAAILRSCVIDAARRVMGHADAGQIRTDRPLMEQGLDSLMSVELRNLLSAGLGIPLPVGLLFNHPSVDDLARHLADLIEIDPEHAPPGNREKTAEKGNDEFGYIDALEAAALETLIQKEISLS
jgi:NAD(P)-dependent dehydrogenase (short-subunit alcohol dehydrogenase family)/acyl carrier protein